MTALNFASVRVAESTAKREIEPSVMIDPSTYKKIALASTFSPRFKQVIAEAKRVRDRFGSELSLIYVGECTEETTKKFKDTLAELGLPVDSAIHYQQGDPAEAILKAATENDVDLILAGALEKEVVLHPFLGNVARRLVREANCSVLLFTKPDQEPKPLRHIVFVADYTDHGRDALQRAFHLAALESSERLHVVRVYTTFDEARAGLPISPENSEPRPRTFEQEEAALEEFILGAGHTEVPIEAHCIRGTTGFAASDFVESVDADLLVVPAHAHDHAKGIPNHIAWITNVIPCNLWVIR